MFTARDAREISMSELDLRIEAAVRASRGNSAYLRIYSDDSFRYRIAELLGDRGFRNIEVPDIVLSGDVYFEWDA